MSGGEGEREGELGRRRARLVVAAMEETKEKGSRATGKK